MLYPCTISTEIFSRRQVACRDDLVISQKTWTACLKGGGGLWTEVHDKIVHFLERLLNQIPLLHAVQWIANSYLNVIVTAHSQQFRCVREIKVYPRIDLPTSFVNYQSVRTWSWLDIVFHAPSSGLSDTWGQSLGPFACLRLPWEHET